MSQAVLDVFLLKEFRHFEKKELVKETLCSCCRVRSKHFVHAVVCDPSRHSARACQD